MILGQHQRQQAALGVANAVGEREFDGTAFLSASNYGEPFVVCEEREAFRELAPDDLPWQADLSGERRRHLRVELFAQGGRRKCRCATRGRIGHTCHHSLSRCCSTRRNNSLKRSVASECIGTRRSGRRASTNRCRSFTDAWPEVWIDVNGIEAS